MKKACRRRAKQKQRKTPFAAFYIYIITIVEKSVATVLAIKGFLPIQRGHGMRFMLFSRIFYALFMRR